MKQSQIFLIFILQLIFLESVHSGKVDVLSSDSKYLNTEYTSLFQIPLSIMTLFSNGGERSDHELSKAFDNNWDTQWFSEGQQGISYTNPKTNVTYNSLVNNIIITFNKTVIIDKMVYKTDNCNGCEGIGYPLELKIYSKLKTDANKALNPYDESGFTLIDDIVSDFTQDIVLFTFNQTIKCDQIKIEWANLKTYSPRFEKFTTAKEIILLFPETEYFNETILNLFSKSDYTQMILNPEFNSVEIIENMIEKCKDLINFNDEIKDYLKRAKLAAAGSLKFDEKREFTTNQTATRNVIRRRGDIASYSRNILKMAMAGTNRQSMGIYALPGEKITFYVTGEDNDKLPYIRFTQYIGHYNNWLGTEVALKKGKQSYYCNNFNVSSYSIDATPGGPLYISNPYIDEQQSNNVKIYVEGGTLFPTFRLNESEEEYKLFLSEYVLMYINHNTSYLDITELFGYRTMITVPATSAYKIYQDENKGPLKNLQTWDEYIKKLFIYDGIEYETSQPHYDIRNTYINLHVRYSQPFGAAYAGYEHIGIFSDGWINTAIYAETFGWGFAHEIGHTMDINERTVSENSNNMISKYDDAYLRKDGSRGEFDKSLEYLTLDDVDVLQRGCTTDSCKGYFTNLQMNFLVWWYLESFNPGYWGKLDNMYRYDYSLSEGMTRTERLIFFSNIIMGIDLGYYFNRWGFFLNNEGIFNPDNTTTEYQEKMDEYINNGKIDKNTQYKFWYIDYKEYLYIVEGGEGCYKDSTKYDIQIKNIFYIDNSKTILLLPEVNCKGHLGFEIYENDKLIGFTYENNFVDTNTYSSDYVQKYKIIAIDRKLIQSKESEVKSRVTGMQVCSFNSKIYNSIKEAVDYAESLDTDEDLNIYLLKDSYEGTISINKKINIYLDEESENIHIYRIDDGALFNINEGGALLIEGKSEQNKIILDGLSLSHKGNLLYNNKGVFKGNYLSLQNNYNSDNNGGAIWGLSSTIELNNSLIYNNYAKYGGGYLGQMPNGRMSATFTNVVFDSNRAVDGAGIRNLGVVTLNDGEIKNCHSTNNGGGISNEGGGQSIIKGTKISNNIADNMGGGLYFDGTGSLTSVEISNNEANFGGGLTFSAGNNARILTLEQETIIKDNNAYLYGGGIYMVKGSFNLNGAEIYDNEINGTKGLSVSNYSDILFIENGEINIDAAKFSGSIFKSNSATIKLKSKLLKYNDDDKIYIDFTNNGHNRTLFTGNNYCITSEDLSNVNLIDSNAGTFELTSDEKGNSLLFIPKILSISFNTLKTQTTLISLLEESEENDDDLFYYGKEITLSQDLFPVKENEYVKRLYDQNGNEYTLGQKLKLVDNIQFLYDIGYKNIIKLDFIDYQENKLVIPDEYLTLPSFRKDYDTEKVILNWKDQDSDEIFKKYEKIKGDKNRTLLVVYSQGEYFLIQLSYLDNNSSKLLKFDDSLTFPNLTLPSDNHFMGWKDELSNKTYGNNVTSISVKNKYVFMAVIVSYVKYYVNNDLLHTETYDVNSSFVLYDKSNFPDFKISNWIDEKNNVEYYYDEEYVIRGDIELYAVLERNNALIFIIVAIAILLFLIAAFLTYKWIRRKNINNKIEEMPNSPIEPRPSLQTISD